VKLNMGIGMILEGLVNFMTGMRWFIFEGVGNFLEKKFKKIMKFF